MLQKMIKRDGSIEPFSRTKIDKWAIWGNKGLNINWSVIVDKVLAKHKTTAKTTEIQKDLISELLQLGTSSGNKMAGRLYMADIAVDVHDRVYPPLKHQLKKLKKLKLMRSLDYSDEELDQLDKIIDHDRNYEMQYDQVKQIYKKYSLSNSITGEIYETPQYVFMRIALHVCESEDRSTRIASVIETYQYLSLNKVNSPSPNYINIGTNHLGLASCCLYTTGDSIDSLEAGNHVGYKMTAMSAGIGGYMALRSIGDPIRSASIVHQGKMPYMKDIGGRVTANIQAGRGGACNQFYSCYDPEALTMAMAQNPRTPESKKNRDIHFTVMFNDWFFYKANSKKDIFTFTAFSAPDLHAALFSGDHKKFADLYKAYENDDNFVKKYVNAAKLLAEIAQQDIEVATHYELNISEVNRHTPFNEPIYSSNLCVAPETPILTKEHGYIEISKLKDKETHVWNGEQWSKTTIRKTGENRSLMLVRTSGNSVLEVTPEHKWYVQEQGIHGGKAAVVEKRTHELQVGDKLIKHNLSVCDHGDAELDMAYENGFYTGDGTDLGYNRSRVYLYGNKKELFKHFTTTNGICSWRTNSTRIEIDYQKNILNTKFTIPDINYTVKSRLLWLAGLMDADGCLTNNQGALSIQLCSTNYDFLIRLKLMLQELSVKSFITEGMDSGIRQMPDHKGGSKKYFCKKVWRILISNEELIKLKDLGFNPNRLSLLDLRPGNRAATRFEQILEVYDKGRFDDTYCFTEPLKNMGMFGGLLLGNCVEITQPTSPYNHIMDLYKEEELETGEVSLCSLGAIVESNIIDDDDYLRACYVALKIVDFCIDNADYVLPHIGYTAKRRRNAAIGIVGPAYTLAKKGIRYSSPEGLIEHHRIAERHAYFVIKASLQLGKERGNAEWIHKTKWPQGWTPAKTYKRTVDELVDPSYCVYDWDELSEEIIANKGIRNSSVIAEMPTESSSKATGLPNSYYPVRALVLTKSDLNNTIEWVAKDNDIFGDQYELAYTIPPKNMVNVHAVYQKWTDMSLSADEYHDRSVNPWLSQVELVDLRLYAHKYGVKAKYYSNSLTSNQDYDKVVDGNNDCGGGCTI